MNKFMTILVPIVFFGFFVAVHISGPNSKDGKGDQGSPTSQPTHMCPLIRLAGMSLERRSAVFGISRQKHWRAFMTFVMKLD